MRALCTSGLPRSIHEVKLRDTNEVQQSPEAISPSIQPRLLLFTLCQPFQDGSKNIACVQKDALH